MSAIFALGWAATPSLWRKVKVTRGLISQMWFELVTLWLSISFCKLLGMKPALLIDGSLTSRSVSQFAIYRGATVVKISMRLGFTILYRGEH